MVAESSGVHSAQVRLAATRSSGFVSLISGGARWTWLGAGPFACFSTTRLPVCAHAHTTSMRGAPPTCTASSILKRKTLLDRQPAEDDLADDGGRGARKTIQSWLRAPRPYPCAGASASASRPPSALHDLMRASASARLTAPPCCAQERRRRRPGARLAPTQSRRRSCPLPLPSCRR